MKSSGLVEMGYQYLNLDDCWQSSIRDEEGRLQGDLTNFPSGIKKLVEDVNAQGMKLGLYTSNGTLTCEDLPLRSAMRRRTRARSRSGVWNILNTISATMCRFLRKRPALIKFSSARQASGMRLRSRRRMRCWRAALRD